MKPEQARALVTETFPQTFDKGRFHHFVKELLNGFDETKAAPMTVPDAFAPHVRSCSRLGTYESPDRELADVLVVHTTEPWKLERTRTALRDFVAHKLKRGDNYKEAGLVAFVAPDARSWRFSFVRMEYESKRDPKTGKIAVEKRLTPARRFSYIVGENESCHTAQSRFLDLLQDTENKPPLAKIEEAFSVETVTDEFFKQYKALFHDLTDEIEALAKLDKTIRDEFAEKKVKTEDFAKKLMGQIVFLYFLQKKGWLGVPKGGEWGDGAHNFLRQLFNGKFGDYKNYFNDILEPLFYGTLADDRTKENDWSDKFNCRIPFLNGGLFEPLRDYDWNKTDIIIPNRIFANSDFVEQGVTGTGILDVFDRYNFTVNEAEPLEKEVAVDPEMLGKVFEKLLDVKERKSKGSFYTPREIVHYMCQESLINYLDTAANSHSESIGTEKRKQAKFSDEKAEQTLLTAAVRKELVPRADIETFIYSGDQFGSYAAAITAEKLKGEHYPKLPEPIVKNARLLNDKLADIAVCDPAIGSGAFPVGMMQEIVRARSALTPYLEDEIKKDKQLTQSEKDKKLAELKEEATAYALKKHTIQNCLYGVDIDPGAVEIAKLRLWLSLVVDEDDVKQIKPLPNLDYKVVTGNSLLGVEKNLFNAELFKRLEELKPKYFDATDRKQKEKFKHEIDSLIHELTNGKEAFDFEIYFSEVMDKKRRGGFDVVMGNPPYGLLNKRQNKHEAILVTEDDLDYYRSSSEYQPAAGGVINVFRLFIVRSVRILNKGGFLSEIFPLAFACDVSAGELRKHLFMNHQIFSIEAFPERDDENRRVFEGVKMSVCILHLKANKQPDSDFFLRIHKDKYVDTRNEKVILNHKVIRAIDGINHTIPLLKSSELAMLEKVYKSAETISSIGHCYTGEIDLTQDKKYLSDDKKLSVLLKGAIIDKYRIRTTMSQGEIMFLNAQRYLAENHGKRSTHHKLKRIVMQGITGVNERIRLKATLAEPPTFCANSVNYIVLSSSKINAKYLLGLFNSALMNFIFSKSSTNSNVNGYEVDNLPIKIIPSLKQEEVVRLVDRILSAKQRDAGADVSALEREIDELVYALYGLTPDEIKIVEGASA